jgi:hypothetical protein
MTKMYFNRDKDIENYQIIDNNYIFNNTKINTRYILKNNYPTHYFNNKYSTTYHTDNELKTVVK